MTSRPRLKTDVNYLPGLAAVALFAVLAFVFLTAQFGQPVGFGEGSITRGIGFAMFDMVELSEFDSEPFLVSFIIIAVVLDAALDGTIMLAKREGSDGPLGGARDALLTDGGHAGTEDDD
ncbi:hypothetical protein [Halomarina ordinaria]|uniref:Proton-conducting membrane transporter n=1 Tax=Halomarina ordinaria TaxID=3033939 RepID=A0ABD5UDB2_9EURY|nr:hypothetical protein [Halomarina sp. PSRA2]